MKLLRTFTPVENFPAFASGRLESEISQDNFSPVPDRMWRHGMLAEEILMINDGSLLLKMMGGLLENKGYHVILTDSPEEALVRLSTRHIVLVVMKLNGQQNDRLAVTHMVRELNGDARLIILGESTHLPAEIFEIGADDYILLPCRTAEIWRRLLSSLEPAAPSAPVRAPESDLIHPLVRRVFNNLGLMFHDLRGQLTSINEGMKTLHRRTDGTWNREVEILFQETVKKTNTLMRMADEFLQKFQNRGQVASSTRPVDLREEVVGPILEEMKDDLQQNCITLDNRLSLLPPAQQVVRGDRVALKSVFRNLLQNAVLHGGYGCTISLEMDEAPTHFRLRVHNNGEPLSSQCRREIFNAAQKDRGNGKGAGLGLYLGRELMQSQGGDILCEPCQQGTEFILTLPRA